MTEQAMLDGAHVTMNRYRQLRSQHPVCACGQRATRWGADQRGQSFGSCRNCRRSQPASQTPRRSGQRLVNGRTDAERIAQLREIQRSIVPARVTPPPARRFRSDAERNAALRRVQAAR
jgi:hypothetical protein